MCCGPDTHIHTNSFWERLGYWLHTHMHVHAVLLIQPHSAGDLTQSQEPEESEEEVCLPLALMPQTVDCTVLNK